MAHRLKPLVDLTKKEAQPTWPGALESHTDVVYCLSNSGALSFWSSVSIATTILDTRFGLSESSRNLKVIMKVLFTFPPPWTEGLPYLPVWQPRWCYATAPAPDPAPSLCWWALCQRRCGTGPPGLTQDRWSIYDTEMGTKQKTVKDRGNKLAIKNKIKSWWRSCHLTFVLCPVSGSMAYTRPTEQTGGQFSDTSRW